MIESTMKQRLRDGEVLIGAFFKANNPNMAEMMGYAGYDFIIIDNEHSNFDHVDVENIVRAADGVGMDTIVRIASGSEENILHTLDSGATGIQVPSVRNVEEVEAFAPFTKYYPVGRRGMNVNQRAARFGFMKSSDYFQKANENTLVVVHVENLEMAAQIDALCAIDAVDVIFIGPGDLSQAVGKPMQVNAPEVMAVVDRIIECTLAADKILGVWVGNADDARRYIERGARYLGYKSDSSILVNALMAVGDEVKKLKT